MKLDPEKKIDIQEILNGLDKYQPRRKGWTWRSSPPDGKLKMGEFLFKECSEPLSKSIPLPAAKYFGDIDPQPICTITTEIASGRFEDDIRRMRMAAWHGADHIMVIRTTGQSHFDGLIEGTPEGIGGVPITRKQIRATRKALDMIEDEVGRPINFHSYVSGIAGPEIAVLFSEEGVNGAHQDPQYNVLYRNINMYRSFVDAAEAKKIMADAGILQIDGAHNANATSKKAWKVMPELLVQHAVNSAYSVAVGMDKNHIGLSTVPPTSSPGPKFYCDFPYAIALRELFAEFRMRAQQNTRYIESDTDEATVTHVIDTAISALSSADIQSTITPDEGRNVPWHYNSIAAIDAAKQTFNALDGIKDLLEVKKDGPIAKIAREIKERAVLFMEEILEMGGYFNAVKGGYFVDSGNYPERNGDGISRDPRGGVEAGTIVKREKDYFAPVCSHFGYNNIPEGFSSACAVIGGCTLCKPGKIRYIDELDENDNVESRLKSSIEDEKRGVIKPEVEWHGDGTVLLQLFIPEDPHTAEMAALEMAKDMGLKEPHVINKRVMHPAEGVCLEVRAKYTGSIRKDKLPQQVKEKVISIEEITDFIRKNPLTVVGATLGEDEHSVGLREMMDIKHGGLEKFGIRCINLGTSVPVGKLVDAAMEIGAGVILCSTIITHADVHILNMKRLNQAAIEKGIRDKVLLIGGGTQISREIATKAGMDTGFGRGTSGIDVANFIVRVLSGAE